MNEILVHWDSCSFMCKRKPASCHKEYGDNPNGIQAAGHVNTNTSRHFPSRLSGNRGPRDRNIGIGFELLNHLENVGARLQYHLNPSSEIIYRIWLSCEHGQNESSDSILLCRTPPGNSETLEARASSGRPQLRAMDRR
jgi:hypothetical protein